MTRIIQMNRPVVKRTAQKTNFFGDKKKDWAKEFVAGDDHEEDDHDDAKINHTK